MKIDGRAWRTIWRESDSGDVGIIDQTALPHHFTTLTLAHVDQTATAIRDMQVRGAPLIGATAAYGVALAMRAEPSDEALERALTLLGRTRPTAVNLHWALHRMASLLRPLPPGEREAAAYDEAAAICDEDVAVNAEIGRHGLALIEAAAERHPHRPVAILTHCNAGALATVDLGTATAPIYAAHEAGIPVHVFVDETRPRLQGALTAWELAQHDIPHEVIADNAGGHLMQRGEVDLVIVGTDRTTARGDVANKIGTYLKALAAQDNGVPFYVALPSSTLDMSLTDGFDIPIEERGPAEVTHMAGLGPEGVVRVGLYGPGTHVRNPAFDVTPARLVTGLITERGIVEANAEAIARLFPDRMGVPA